MKLKHLVEKYINHRQMMGEKFRTNATALRAFCHYLGENSLSHKLSAKKVLKFLYSKDQITTGWFIKRTNLQGFYDYAMCRGYIKGCPLPKDLPKRPPGLIPYIYSKHELRLLFDTALTYKSKSIVEPYAVKVLLQLLYATGLRLSEALSLTMEDVDISSMVIVIRETKFYKKRLVPFNQQVSQIFADYLVWRNKTASLSAAMFISKRGLGLNINTMRNAFQRIRKKAGIKRLDKANCQPRLHDYGIPLQFID